VRKCRTVRSIRAGLIKLCCKFAGPVLFWTESSFASGHGHSIYVRFSRDFLRSSRRGRSRLHVVTLDSNASGIQLHCRRTIDCAKVILFPNSLSV
jgi:hypothetical protein